MCRQRRPRRSPTGNLVLNLDAVTDTDTHNARPTVSGPV
jgi:hypothetical protein